MPQTPAFRAAGTTSFTGNNVSTPTTLTPGAPAGKTVGDLLVLVCMSRSITATVATPTGWTIVTGFPKRSGTASGGSIYVFTRTADGTATDTPSPVWTGLTTGTTGDSSSAVILCYTSSLTATLDGTIAVSDLSAQGTTSSITGLTTAKLDSLVLAIAFKVVDSNAASTSTWTERVDAATTSGTGHEIEIADTTVVNPGASGASTVTWGTTTSSRVFGVSIGFAAAALAAVDADTPGSVTTPSSVDVETSVDSATISGTSGPLSIAYTLSESIDTTGASSGAIGWSSVGSGIAQSFIPTNDTYLTQLILQLRLLAGAIPSGNLHINIVRDASGSPTGTTIASGTLDVSTLTSSAVDRIITLDSIPLLTGGQKYWITTNYPDWVTGFGNPTWDNNSTDVYANGGRQTTASYPTGWGSASVADMMFSVVLSTRSIAELYTPAPIDAATISSKTTPSISDITVYREGTILFDSGSPTSTVLFGDTTNNQQIAQNFTADKTGTITSLEISLRKQGAPTDNVLVDICSDASGIPGTVLGTTDPFPLSSLSTSSSSRYDLFFSSGGPSITAGTIYWLVVRRDGALDSSNLATAQPSTVNIGSLYRYNGTIWSIIAAAPSLWFALYPVVTSTPIRSITIPSAVETTDYLDSTIISSTTDISASNEVYTPGTAGTTYTDADTPVCITSLSAVETTGYAESNTILGITTPAVSDVEASLDSNTINGSTSLSAVETAQYVDSSIIAGVTTPVSVEEHDIPDSSIITGTTTPSASDIAAYIEVNTLTSITSLSITDLYAAVDQSTTASITTPSSTDIASFVESGTITSNTNPSSVDTSQYTELNTIVGQSSVIFSELYAAVDQATISGLTFVSSLEEHDIPDSNTINGVTVVFTTDTAQYVESGTINSITTPISVEEHSTYDSATNTTTTTITSADVAAYVDRDTPNSITSISELEEHDIPDSDTISVITVITSADIAAYVEAATTISITSLTYTEVSAYVDDNTIQGITTLSSIDVAAYIDSNTTTSITTVIPSDTLLTPGRDADTLSTTTTPTIVEFAAYVDSSLVQSSTSITTLDAPIYAESGAPAVITTPSSNDIAAFVDQSTISGFTTPVGLVDTYAGLDSNTINSFTSINIAEVYGRADSDTIPGTTVIASDDIAAYLDQDTPTGLTYISSTEEYIPLVTFLDSATIESFTHIITIVEYGPIVEIDLIGTASRRWTSTANMNYSGVTTKRWFSDNDITNHYSATRGTKRWFSVWI